MTDHPPMPYTAELVALTGSGMLRETRCWICGAVLEPDEADGWRHVETVLPDR
jgi:hypothetical protein